MAEGLTTLGVNHEVLPDGIIIEGGPFGGGEIRTFHDHRIAMSFAIAALRASAPITVLDCDHVATSFPGFSELARRAGLQLNLFVSMAQVVQAREQLAFGWPTTLAGTCSIAGRCIGWWAMQRIWPMLTGPM